MRWRPQPRIQPFPVHRARTRIRTMSRCRTPRAASRFVRFVFFAVDIYRRGDDVLTGSPVAEIDQLAAFAAERHERIGRLYRLRTDRTLHRFGRAARCDEETRIGNGFTCGLAPASSASINS